MVLGHSRHQFSRVVFDQRAETWIQLHEQAFRFFGGVPRTIVPDNLKAAVIRAAFGVSEPGCSLNRSYRELARHYGFKVDPTPPAAPKKKGKVESCVKYVKNNALKGRDGESIDDVNAELERWVKRDRRHARARHDGPTAIEGLRGGRASGVAGSADPAVRARHLEAGDGASR
jgi:transposase